MPIELCRGDSRCWRGREPSGAWVIEDDYDSEFRFGTRPIPCLHGLDVDNRVIYVGSFSKTLFPALRLGFLIVPPDIRDAWSSPRDARQTIHQATLGQAVLADFMAVRPLLAAPASNAGCRRTGAVRDAPALRPPPGTAAARCRLRPAGYWAARRRRFERAADDDLVFHEAMARGVEAMPLSGSTAPTCARQPPTGFVLGFAAVRPDLFDAGMAALAAAIRAARRGAGRRDP